MGTMVLMSKLFDRVNHDLLTARVVCKVKDKRMLRLIGLYLRASVVTDGEIVPTAEDASQ